MEEFFQKVIDVLNKHSIPFMLSGSIAMGLYIVPRSTRDFDFIVHLSFGSIDEFVKNFEDGYYCDRDAIEEAIREGGMFNIIDHASGFKADFVILRNEPFRKQEFSRRKQIDFYGKTIYVVTPEDLLISKLIWIQDYQSKVQIEDIKQLTKIETLDWPYISEWINKLKLNTFALLPS